MRIWLACQTKIFELCTKHKAVSMGTKAAQRGCGCMQACGVLQGGIAMEAGYHLKSVPADGRRQVYELHIESV